MNITSGRQQLTNIKRDRSDLSNFTANLLTDVSELLNSSCSYLIVSEVERELKLKRRNLKAEDIRNRYLTNVMSGLRTKLPVDKSLYSKREDDDMPYLPLDQHVPTYVLGKRRQGISSGCESPYCSKPRMRRRGAISYETTDAAAEYIRYLGKGLYTALFSMVIVAHIFYRLRIDGTMRLILTECSGVWNVSVRSSLVYVQERWGKMLLGYKVMDNSDYKSSAMQN